MTLAPLTADTAAAADWSTDAALQPEKHWVRAFLDGFSVETSVGAAAKVDSFADHLPAGTRVFIACLPGQDFATVADCAVRLAGEGMVPVPHLPARSIPSEAVLDAHLARLAGEAGVTDVLVIGGGVDRPVGPYDRSAQVIESGLLDRHGIRRIGVAGHPEGNRDIGEAGIRHALAEKNAYAERTGLDLHVVTQFAFDGPALVNWDKHLTVQGNRLPIHIGIAGPATLKSLLHYATMCGIGNSMRVLKRQALNITRLTQVSAPDRLVLDLARYRATDPDCRIARAHFFTFGGFKRSAKWLSLAAAGEFELDGEGGFRVLGEF
jgi:methylenetetrahydrofolate reductase (NADPH)